MRHLDSEALATFLAVAEAGSFTAAARRLNKSQAAVSIAIGRLEERLGKRLFDRLPRRAALTSAGERLQYFAQKILALEDEAISSLTDAAYEARVRLGMPDDYLDLFGGALVKDFTLRYPLVGIDLRCGFSCQLEALVEARELDMAIVTQDPMEPKGEILRIERQVWCAGPGRYPETAPVLRLALFPDGCRSKPLVLRALEKAGQPWKISYSSSSIQGLQLAVASSDIATVLPESAVPADWRRLDESYNLPKIPPLRLALYTFQQSRLPVRQVITFMRRNFSDVSTFVQKETTSLL